MVKEQKIEMQGVVTELLKNAMFRVRLENGIEILTKDFRSYKNKITNAGSIGLGKYSPVASSDYAVGVNHVLGCYGSSKYASGLNLSDFYKKYSQISS